MTPLSRLAEYGSFKQRSPLALWVVSAGILVVLGLFTGLVTLIAVTVAGPGWDGIGTMLFIFALALPVGFGLSIVLVRLTGRLLSHTMPWLYATAVVIAVIASMIMIFSIANTWYPTDPPAALDVLYIIGAWAIPLILTRVWLDVAYRLHDRRQLPVV